MPTPTPTSESATATASGGAVPGAKSPLSVPEGAPGITTTTVQFPPGGTEISGYLARPESGKPGPAVLVCHENHGLTQAGAQRHVADFAAGFDYLRKQNYVKKYV